MRLKAPTIFIVEDDTAICDALSCFFQLEGFAVKIYHNAQTFLAAYEPISIGCLLVDMRMPGMNGLDLQAELNARRSELPIIFMSGNGDGGISARAIKAGAFYFITKPFKMRDLLDKIQAAIAYSQKQLK